MVQVFLFALVGFSSALVNLGVYNLVLWGLQTLGLFPGIDFLIAQFFGFVISVAWAFWFNRRYVFRTPGAPWKESLIKVYITYSITGIGLSFLYHSVVSQDDAIGTFTVDGLTEPHAFHVVYTRNTNAKKYSEQFLSKENAFL